MKAVRDQSGILGEFLDWLVVEKDIRLCRWQDTIYHGTIHDMSEYTPKGYYLANERIEQLLADFFEIDLDKIEQEKQAMLDEIRKAQKGVKHG